MEARGLVLLAEIRIPISSTPRWVFYFL